jgi:hypothetical protein
MRKKITMMSTSPGFIHGLPFQHEDGDIVLFLNVGLSLNYLEAKPKPLHLSWALPAESQIQQEEYLIMTLS